MIESDDYHDPVTGRVVYSLYGATRKPTAAMLEGVDALLFDLQDVGTRVYTFISTMALAMQACAEQNKRFVVLDRPNPIGGRSIEGNILDPKFASFVGIYPIPMRHGMTVGEFCLSHRMASARHMVRCTLEPFATIAYTHGYEHPCSFSSAYKAYHGCSPKADRLTSN